MQALIFFRITEKKLETKSEMVSKILAPTSHTIEVIAITQKPEEDSRQQYYLHLTHSACAILHLKENGRFEMLKNRSPEIARPTILLRAFKLFIEKLGVSVEH